MGDANVPQPSVLELTIPGYHRALRDGQTTCLQTISAYLSRISTYNPTLRALITINPNALEEANQRDLETAKRGESGNLPPLHGVPIILKDTYTTTSMPTTSGVQALHSLTTTTNAFVVTKLLSAGAIILAKANLHELSLEGVSVSSIAGQTLNPYDLTRTPGGSSGGTAAALAANLGMVGCGGDTMNSLRSPASACAIVGFRPTKGQVSKRGIAPVSTTQDVAGPMARTVNDVRILFDVMRGEDPEDPTTINPLRHIPRTYNPDRPLKIGILTTYFGDPSTPDGQAVNTIINNALDKISLTPNIQLLPLSNHPEWTVPTLRASADTQAYEFQTTFDAFLQSPTVSTPHKTLSSIASSGHYHKTAVSSVFWDTLAGGEFTPSSPEYRSRLARIEELKVSVQRCFDENDLTAIVYPHQSQLVAKVGSMVQPGRNGILAALTGRPAVCVPGFTEKTESAAIGVPVGLEIMGKPWEDEEVLWLGEMLEGGLGARRMPLI